MGFVPSDPDGEVGRFRRHLPHWNQRGKIYFVTSRLGDSIPRPKIDEWKAERKE